MGGAGGKVVVMVAEAVNVDEDFLKLADPFRRELLAHCYRMLGSVHDAEDLVQETYLRAWRAYDRFEGRSSLRTWLHRIATSACLTALESRSRRPLPTGLGSPCSDADTELGDFPEVTWLEPLPDAAVNTETAEGTDPAAIVTNRESVRLAFIAALQHLPARQRAILILRDVLAWRANEVADALGISTAAVNSMLQRARAQLEKVSPSPDSVTEPSAAEQKKLLDKYMVAFEQKDIPGIVALFTEDVVWEMPPFAEWYLGGASIGRHLDIRCPAGPGGMRTILVWANGQPAVATYLREHGCAPDAEFRAFTLQVLTLTVAGISHVVNFLDVALFADFGLPLTLAGDTPFSEPLAR
jgi:RNA polymerase sigma-70 factor (ECF subfamily)